MKPIKPRNRTLYFLAFAVLFVVVIPFIIMYSLGYRFTKDYALTERGGIYVFASESGSNIFINGELKKTTGTFQKELFLQNLKPGAYLVRVSNEMFGEWTKNVLVTKREVAALYPFLVPLDVGLAEVRSVASTTSSTVVSSVATTAPAVRISVAEYQKISALFKAPTQKTVSVVTATSSTSTPEANALVKKRVKVWADGAKVFARFTGDASRAPAYFCLNDAVAVSATSTPQTNCLLPLEVFNAFSPISHVDFYPGRDDAVIISVNDYVFAMELDTRPKHNLYVLYRGTKPDFRVNDNKVYVQDGKFLGQFTLL